MIPFVIIEIGDGFQTKLEFQEASIQVYTFPQNANPRLAGRLSSAAWHFDHPSGIKIAIRIAGTDASNNLVYYNHGIALGKSLCNVPGFDMRAFQQAQDAIANEKDGRFICWKRSDNVGNKGVIQH